MTTVSLTPDDITYIKELESLPIPNVDKRTKVEYRNTWWSLKNVKWVHVDQGRIDDIRKNQQSHRVVPRDAIKLIRKLPLTDFILYNFLTDYLQLRLVKRSESIWFGVYHHDTVNGAFRLLLTSEILFSNDDTLVKSNSPKFYPNEVYSMRRIQDILEHTEVHIVGVAALLDIYELINVESNIFSVGDMRCVNKVQTTFKSKLIQSVVVPPALKKDSSIGRIVREALKLEESILFVNIHVDKEFKKTTPNVNFEHLPFDDFMCLVDMAVDTVDGVEESLTRNGFLFRVKKVSESCVRIYGYFLTDGGKYSLILALETTEEGGHYRQLIKNMPYSTEEITVSLLPIIKRFIWLITSHHTKVENTAPTNFSFTKKVKPVDRPKYIEYTLDLSKPIRRSGASLGGSHASPVEHVRRGHWRRTRNGKRVFIEAIVVNKGKGGRVEKDYTMN